MTGFQIPDAMTIEDLRALPNAAPGYGMAFVGVYFLWDGTELVYIGKSENVPKRIAEHMCAGRKRFTSVTCLRAVSQRSAAAIGEIDSIESCYINLYRPRYNKGGLFDDMRLTR